MAERKGTLGIVCAICRTGFMSSQSRVQLQAHIDSKHSAKAFLECFPDCADKL
jgi:Zinc-binding